VPGNKQNEQPDLEVGESHLSIVRVMVRQLCEFLLQLLYFFE
jgi:hypothetical protein